MLQIKLLPLGMEEDNDNFLFETKTGKLLTAFCS